MFYRVQLEQFQPELGFNNISKPNKKIVFIAKFIAIRDVVL